MELYIFGFRPDSQPPAASQESTVATPVLQAKAIKLLWSSWCDAVIVHQDVAGSWSISYRGTSLTATQTDHLCQSAKIKDSLSNDVQTKVHFFGSAMHHGLGGYAISSTDSSESVDQITLFATDSEVEQGIPEVQSYPMSGTRKVTNIRVLSDETLLLSIQKCLTDEDKIASIPNIKQLRDRLSSGTSFPDPTHPPRASFIPTRWATNATTVTILDEEERVWTSTRDPRYPKCLGRPYEGTSDFELVPYLSETRIAKIASGGYMSAAVSNEGELFVWGQACPGSEGEPSVLNGNMESNQSTTGIYAESEQEEFVRCLTVKIEVEEAIVCDVAIGHGHILVAAELHGSVGEEKKVVFAAGDNSRGQLGLASVGEFVEDFVEVADLKGKRIAQLAAAGWSSFVVTADDI
ncbi:hypothetical protein EJ02DRAFT_382908 [Clathrospora elynae]|uniref:RCC1/BLIP-II n=1 Tax=Clathrospora elynae TaxID=706981 RepID=A0A6A5SNV1_9PLEO|nr:hypothetical protein EJ02DRAFT_382908 [Clathrospora elynae]